MVNVEAEPHVQQITFQGHSSVMPSGPILDVNCTVSVRVSSSSSSYTFSISAFAAASQWEAELNGISLVTQVGYVKVMKMGYVGDGADFWSASNSITLEIVFVTNNNVTESSLPAISIDSNIMCSSNSSVQLRLNVTNTVSQTLSVPSSFSLGFNQTVSRMPRFTSQVPTNSTPNQFEQRLKELLSYGCMEDDRISAKSDTYETYETASTTRTHPHAFCGFQSKNDPRTVRSSDYNLLSIPFVSLFILQ